MILENDVKANINTLINESKFDEALKLCKQSQAQFPGDVEYLYMMGVVLGQLGDYVAAEKIFRKALKSDPDNIMLSYNLGVALLRLKRWSESIEMLSRVAQLEPGQFDTWLYLGQACEASGSVDNALIAYQKAIELKPDSDKVLKLVGKILLAAENWVSAADVFVKLIEMNPDDQEVINSLGIALSSAYQYEKLLQILKPVALNQSFNIVPNYYVAMAHIELGEIDNAMEFFNKALAIDSAHVESAAGLAAIYNLKGMHDKALELIKPLVKSIAPRFGESKQAITLLKRHIDSKSVPDITKGKMAIALGRIYEKENDYERAFRFYKRGNKLYSPDFDRENHARSIDVLEEIYTENTIDSMPVSANKSQQPIFIVGMPRSGTTLVEQILASHSNVYGAGELKFIQNYCFDLHDQQINNKSFPYCLEDVSPDELLRLANEYQSELNNLSSNSVKVTDKMPNNFQNLGLIYQMFPDAKVIHCVRDPMDTCLSCYFQFFSGAHMYSYDLSNLGFYYRSYERLMNHWKSVLPLQILDVSYENLVKNQEKVTREMLEFCDLDWEDQCLDFHNTERAVATASTDQVRQPIYTGSIDKWRRYEKHLEPLINSLKEN